MSTEHDRIFRRSHDLKKIIRSKIELYFDDDNVMNACDDIITHAKILLKFLGLRITLYCASYDFSIIHGFVYSVIISNNANY